MVEACSRRNWMEVQGCLDEYFPVGDNAAATHQAEKAEKRAQRYDGPIGSAQQQSSVVHGKGRGRGMGRGDYYRREQAHAQVSQQFSHRSGVSTPKAPPPPPPPHVRGPLPPAAAPVMKTKSTQRETPRGATASAPVPPIKKTFRGVADNRNKVLMRACIQGQWHECNDILHRHFQDVAGRGEGWKALVEACSQKRWLNVQRALDEYFPAVANPSSGRQQGRGQEEEGAILLGRREKASPPERAPRKQLPTGTGNSFKKKGPANATMIGMRNDGAAPSDMHTSHLLQRSSEVFGKSSPTLSQNGNPMRMRRTEEVVSKSGPKGLPRKSKSVGRSSDDSAKEIYEQRIEEYRRRSTAAAPVAPHTAPPSSAYFGGRDIHRYRY